MRAASRFPRPIPTESIRIMVQGNNGQRIFLGLFALPPYEITDIVSAGDSLQREKLPTRTRSNQKPRMTEMVRFKSSILLIVLTGSVGCSAIERPLEPQPNRPEQQEEQKSPSVPTFMYRPGAGLMIEGGK